MPGLILFKRRWSVGSDDLVVPAIILFTVHTSWLIVLTIVLIMVDYQKGLCMTDLRDHTIGYIIILIGCILVEGFIAWVSMRGSILNTTPRNSMGYLLYVRLGILIIEIIWLIIGALWFRRHYKLCPSGIATDAIVGITICNWCIVGSVLITIWCTFDSAGRSWVKMRTYQNSLKEGQSKYHYRRSGNTQRNWRHRKTVREYEDSWNRRCRLLFCCLNARNDRHQNSFTEIAKLLSEFFRDLDIVPSDVIAGLMLLRKHQKFKRQTIVNQKQNNTFQYLSGVPITSETRFLDVNHHIVAEEIRTLIHFLHYAIAVYGWPIFMMINSTTGCFKLCPYLRCCGQSPCCFLNIFRKNGRNPNNFDSVYEDNCCQCNYAALQHICKSHNFEMLYATYHDTIGEPPFFVALDHDKKAVVISVRGTLSLQDVITDLNAEGEILPINPIREEWLGHKGMIEAASYIKNKLIDMEILNDAFNHCPEKGTQNYNLILVGHSLGAGTASILAILLREYYPDLVCFAYAPPGGLLSVPALEYTKDFIISVVLGKDVIPRLGLHQMEAMRCDLINSIKKTDDPKWKVIGGGMICCCPENSAQHDEEQCFLQIDHNEKQLSSHPTDNSIALTVHQPLYPPGKIIHIVRNHPKKSDKIYEPRWRQVVGLNEPVFQALWANNTNFDEILISPVMIQDHMPDKLLDALEMLLSHTGPAKPQRQLNIDGETPESIDYPLLSNSRMDTPASINLEHSSRHRMMFETSFTASPLTYRNSIKPNKLELFTDKGRVNMFRDDWYGAAPLASPEEYSDNSSISSYSNGARVNYDINEPLNLCSRFIGTQKQASLTQKYAKQSKENALNIPVIISEAQINFRHIDEQQMEDAQSNDYEQNDHLIFPQNIERNNDMKDEPSSSANSPDDNMRENCDENDSQRCECTKEVNFLSASVHQSSSETDIFNGWDQPIGLRRSHEEMRLNNLDDSAPVFDVSSEPNSSVTAANMETLINKLMTIETIVSPSPDTPIQEHCGEEKAASNVFTKNYF